MQKGIFVVATFFALTSLAFTATIYVPDNYATIQGAIDASANGDVIIVRAGTYVENIDFVGKAITVKSEGGYEVTIIDGNQDSSVITFQNGETHNSIIDGFTITNGTGSVYGASISGGGILCIDNSSPLIINNLITDNSANWGGGICSNNSASPLISYNIIKNNQATNGGGGIRSHEAFPDILGNIICDNQSDAGGGIQCQWHSSSKIVNNIVFNNTATVGGGISCRHSSLIISNNTVANNTATTDGGGFYCWRDSDAVITNSILWGNDALSGPEIWIGDTSSPPATLTISHSDVEGGQSNVYVDPGCTLNWGSGMIDVDPAFLDPTSDNYHLATDSPCIDIGDNNAPEIPLSDFEGDDRIIDGDKDGEATVDIGADEYRPWLYVPDDYPTIQDAINAYDNEQSIIVRSGTYVENIDFIGKAVAVRSESGPNSTIIDGGQTGSVVTFTNGEGPDTQLEGFTITNGSGTYLSSHGQWCGGGVLCESSSPTIVRNKITANSVANNGGGIWCADSSPLIDHNEISYNIANSAWGGAGIVCYGVSTARISNNVIFDNVSIANGGGLYCTGTSCTPVVDNNIIYNNKAEHGGGIFVSDFAEPEFLNNTVVKNEATSTGGGLRCTLSCYPTVTNTIFWNDTSPSGKEIYIGNPNPSPTALDISYSDIDGGQSSVHTESGCQLNWGDGMIDAAPLFSDPSKADFHISRDSPCCNAGYNLGPNLPDEDFEGDPRLAGFVIDIGADEFYTHLYTVGDIVPGDTIEVKVVGIPWFPVALAMDSEFQDPPINTIHGDMYLELPALWQGSIGRVPSNGLLVLPITVPTSWSSGETYYLQALVGYWGGPWTRLTNAKVLVVE